MKRFTDYKIELVGIQPGSNMAVFDERKGEMIVGFNSPGSEVTLTVVRGILNVSFGVGETFALATIRVGLFDRFFRRQKRLMFRARRAGWKSLDHPHLVTKPFERIVINQQNDVMFGMDKPYASKVPSLA